MPNESKPLSGRQFRVLRGLVQTSPCSKATLCNLIKRNPTYIAWAVGQSDPEVRAKYEASPESPWKGKDGKPIKNEQYFFPSLLTRGYVKEIELDIDGVRETVYDITEDGIKAFREAEISGEFAKLTDETME